MRKILTTIGLALFGLYQLAGFVETMSDGNGPFREATGNYYWPARWKMFTNISWSHTVMDFEGWDDGEWVRLPMEEWYPAHWESGYRWERTPVYKYRTLQLPFLAAACEHADMPRVRLMQRSWNKKLGQREEPRGDVREKVLRVRECSDELALPAGKVL